MIILAYPSHGNARHYRLDQISKYLGLQSANLMYISVEQMTQEDLAKADVVVLEQTSAPDKIRLAKEITDQTGALLVAEIDDHFSINPDNPAKENFDKTDAGHWVEVLCGVADLITTTTPELAGIIKNKLAEHNTDKPIAVLPNRLDMEEWDLPILKNYSDEIRILWAGSASHRNDVLSIKPAIEEVCKRYPQVKFLYCGDTYFQKYFKDINSEWIDAVDIKEWPAKLHSIRADIAIAPLEDNLFNRCKSNLKYLEYSTAKLAGVYSSVIYEKTIKEGITGFIAHNQQEWIDKISFLIEHEEVRDDIANNAYLEVRQNYDIKDHALDWIDAYFYHLAKKRRLRLDIGGGISRVNGPYWYNVDVNPKYGELVKDIKQGLPIPDNSIHALHCSAILEHFYIHDLREKVLPELYRILESSGCLYIAVPDLEATLKLKVKDTDWKYFQQQIYGAYHKDLAGEFDLHKYFFDYKHLKEELANAGFKNIKKVPYTEINHDPKFIMAVVCNK